MINQNGNLFSPSWYSRYQNEAGTFTVAGKKRDKNVEQIINNLGSN